MTFADDNTYNLYLIVNVSSLALHSFVTATQASFLELHLQREVGHLNCSLYSIEASIHSRSHYGESKARQHEELTEANPKRNPKIGQGRSSRNLYRTAQ